ncbi:MAG: ABC transporter permease [Rikenellaceae bacterium]|nr:ABC transporter permease [Rikenellaceae bacterium]
MKWRFALRYLISPKSHSVINIIASVSLLSMAVPVAAMVILLSVFNGFEGLVRDLYKAVDADIEIRSTHLLRSDDDALRSRIAECDGVDALSFVVERQAMLCYRDNRTTVQLRGVDADYDKVVPIEEFVSLGDARVEVGDFDRLLVGEGVAYDLGIYSTAAGDVRVMSLGGGAIGSLLPTMAMRSEVLEVCGTFIIDQQHASSFALTSLRAADGLFGCEGTADAVLVRVEEGNSSRRVVEALQQRLGEGYSVISREEKNSAFYAIMRYEKWGVFLVSLLVLLVASLSIIGTVVMLIIEKRDEQTTLRSMGADNALLRGVFVREGLLLSGIGGAIGLVVGIAITLAQQHFGFVKMPNGNFLIENYPVELQALDLVVIFVTFIAVAAAISTVATSIMIKRR